MRSDEVVALIDRLNLTDENRLISSNTSPSGRMLLRSRSAASTRYALVSPALGPGSSQAR
jgi:hypothetical protein